MMILTTKLNLNWVNVNHHFKYLSQQYFTGKFLSGVLQLELVDKFCYLDDMLSVDGDADAAVEARIRIGWNKFRHCLPIRTHTHTHTRLTALFPGLPGWAGTRKVKPIWIY